MNRSSTANTGKQRKQSGSFIGLAAFLAVLVLLPIGIFAFEIARVHMAHQQLKAATDSAALAAASFLFDQLRSNQAAQEQAKALALEFLKRNSVMNVKLNNVAVSSSVNSDNPAADTASFNLVVDTTKRTVTATAAYGLTPAFGGFLGISAVTIRVSSTAGPIGLEGDVVIVVDVSRSMSFASTFVRARRIYNPIEDKLTHEITGSSSPSTGNSGNNQAAFCQFGQPDLYPNPALADFGQTVLMRNLATAPNEVKLAALVEAKAGNLESPAAFTSSKADKSVLADYITPGPGYQADYQRLALAGTQPLADTKFCLNKFVNEVTGGDDVHLGLITYSSTTSGLTDAHDEFSTTSGHKPPSVALSQTSSKQNEVIEALAPTPVFAATATGPALSQALTMLTGPGHRPGRAQTIVLLTDGVWNTGVNPVVPAMEAGKKGIRLLAIGFFHNLQYVQSGESVNGVQSLNQMVAACGNGSKKYIANDVPTLEDVLRHIAEEDGVGLVNP